MILFIYGGFVDVNLFKQLTGKNPRWDPVGDQIPVGEGDRDEFFPAAGNGAGTGGGGVIGDGDGEYAPRPRPAPLPFLGEGRKPVGQIAMTVSERGGTKGGCGHGYKQCIGRTVMCKYVR